jgi:hypothetical protein
VITKPLTKFAHRATNVEEIPRVVAYAYRAANTGIKGPVLLDFPIDVLFSPPQMRRIAYGAVDAPPLWHVQHLILRRLRLLPARGKPPNGQSSLPEAELEASERH